MKETLSILLALTMLLGLMTACGSSEAASSASAASSVESAEETVAAPAEEPEVQEEPAAPAEEPAEASAKEPEKEPEPEPEAEMPADYVLPLYDTPVTLGIFYPVRSGSHPSKSDEKSVFWRRLEENLGYSFEWTEPYQSAASEQFNLVIAAGDLPHIFFESLIAREGSAYTGGYDVAVEEDVYLDMTPYLEEYAPHYNYLLQDPGIYNDIVTEEGRIVPFATINSEAAKTGMGPVVNKEYWEATGLGIPTTIDEMHELAVAMKNNGVNVPLAVSEEGDIVEGLVSQALGASFVGQPIIDNATGELILDMTTDETRSYIELFRAWYDEGLLDKDFTSITEMDFTPFNSGNVGTASGMGFMLDSYYLLRRLSTAARGSPRRRAGSQGGAAQGVARISGQLHAWHHPDYPLRARRCGGGGHAPVRLLLQRLRLPGLQLRLGRGRDLRDDRRQALHHRLLQRPGYGYQRGLQVHVHLRRRLWICISQLQL